MPVIHHDHAREVPWRRGYRRWVVADGQDGYGCSLDHSEIHPGAGAPLHYHQVDEFITVLEGELEVQAGPETLKASANSTIAIPAGVEHGFTVRGNSVAKILVFFPVGNPFAQGYTTYL